MKTELQEHLDFIEGVMHEEKYKKRKDSPNAHTWRYKMAEGLKQVIDHSEHKKELIRKRQAVNAARAELEEIRRRMNEAEKLL